MRRSITPPTTVGLIRLPPELAEEVHRLLQDPRTGRKRYGSLQNLMTILLTNWVEEHRQPPTAGKPAETLESL